MRVRAAVDYSGNWFSQKLRRTQERGRLQGAGPCCVVVAGGGFTETVAAEKVAHFRSLLSEIRVFIDRVYVPDVQVVAAAFPDYYQGTSIFKWSSSSPVLILGISTMTGTSTSVTTLVLRFV